MTTMMTAAVLVGPGHPCPTSEAISAELQRMGALAAVEAVGTAAVAVQGGRLQIVVRDLQGAVVGQREVEAPEGCQARASVAAVLLAAWAGDWSKSKSGGTRPAGEPSDLSPAPVPASTTTSVRVASTTPSSTKPAAVKPPTIFQPKPPTTSAAASAPVVQPRTPGRPLDTVAPSAPERWGLDLGLVGSGVHDGDAGSWGLGLLGCLWGRRFTLVGLAESVSTRQRTLGLGAAEYGALRLGLGGGVRQTWSRFFVDLAVLPEVVRYSLEGKNLFRMNEVTAWGPAVDARVHVGMRFRAWSPFVYLGASYGLLRERLKLDDASDSITLSRLNLAVGLGVSFSSRLGSS